MAKPREYLDGGALFKEYFETMGPARSLAKLARSCARRDIRNPKTGKPPTRMGIWKAMWAWALTPANVPAAKNIFVAAMSSEGVFYTQDDWKEMILRFGKGGVELGRRRYKSLVEATG